MRYCLLFVFAVLVACEPLVDTVSEERDAIVYNKQSYSPPPAKDTILVMTWNIRFGCGAEILWFGDACGSRTVLKRDEVTANLDRLIAEINRIKPDILMIQEIDHKSKRTAYINELQYIMDRTYFGYTGFATQWNSQYIPSDGLGRIDHGKAILSVWPMSELTLHPLPLRNDLDALTKYFYVRETVISAKVMMPDNTEFYVVNAHLSAFSTDDTKQRQLLKYIEICDSIAVTGKPLLTGGDYNLLPPNSIKTDYCDVDRCEDEHFHSEGDSPLHKDGSNYTPEILWLNPLYEKYNPSLPLEIYNVNQSAYFSHTTDPKYYWDRTLDYLFSNRKFVEKSHKVWQELRYHSDHAAVSALWLIRESGK